VDKTLFSITNEASPTRGAAVNEKREPGGEEHAVVSRAREQASDLSVEPIRELDHIRRIKSLLSPRPRDLLLFTLGINNALRAGDLLRVSVNQVRDLKPGECTTVTEKKTGRQGLLTLHPESHQALQRHLVELDPPAPPGNMYLFASDRGWTPLTTHRLDEMVREWARAAGLAGDYGAHTLRKTFGYVQRVHYGVGFDVLAKRLDLASPQVAMRYLGLTSDAPDAPLLREI
jgi:integrase